MKSIVLTYSVTIIMLSQYDIQLEHKLCRNMNCHRVTAQLQLNK